MKDLLRQVFDAEKLNTFFTIVKMFSSDDVIVVIDQIKFVILKEFNIIVQLVF